jgi:hypothetical protein
LGWQIDDTKKLSQTIAWDKSNIPYNIVLIDNTRDYRAMNYRYFLSFYNKKLLNVDNYSQAKSLYLIYDKIEDLNNKDLNIWEIKSFLNFNQNPDLLTTEIESKIAKFWQIPGGPKVYRLDK